MEHLSNPNPLFEIFVGTLILIVVIFVHGVGIRSISLQFSKSWAQVTSVTPHWRLNLMLAVTIAALALLHFAETLIWAVPLYVRDHPLDARQLLLMSSRAIRRWGRAT